MGKKSRLKRQKRENPPFHITIGSSVVSNNMDDLVEVSRHQMRLIKASLLYADEVTLCSPLMHILTAMERMPRFSADQQLELYQLVAPSLSDEPGLAEKLEEFRPQLKMLSLVSRFSPEAKEICDGIAATFGEFRKATEEKAKRFEVSELAELIKRGDVKIDRLGETASDVEIIADSIQLAAQQNGRPGSSQSPAQRKALNDAMCDKFLARLQSAISSPKTYPLFDDFTGDLVRLGLKEGRLHTTPAQTERAKHLGLAANLLERLPSFDNATSKELIDIRRELETPLIKFRAAMIEFSGEIGSASWDADFPIEADKVFRQKVEPAISEIEEAVQNNSYLKALVWCAVEKPVEIATTSGLGLMMSKATFLGDAALGAMGMGAGAGVIALRAWQEHIEKRKDIENNQVFFYYKAQNLIKH